MKIPIDGPVVLSACLAGVECTYKGESKTKKWAIELVASGRAVLVCPEVAGGLGIPRPESEVRNGVGADVIDGKARVISAEDVDVTDAYLRGARSAVDAATRTGAQLAVLKARSPSCGCGLIYDGTFSGTLREGDGVTAAALKRSGLNVVSDEEIE
ncbi:MAG: 2-thiouracil desulfurase family protein [Actinomycetota bacterium]